jgi:hypothetical protein
MEIVDQSGSDTPAVALRPPFLFLGCLILGHALDHLLPLPLNASQNHLLRHAISGGLIVVGIAILVAGISQLQSRRNARTVHTAGAHSSDDGHSRREP